MRKVHEHSNKVKNKYRFEIKVSFIEDERIQVLIFQGSGGGKPIAKGTIEKLEDASRSGFIEMVRQLDGGKIVQVSQYEGSPEGKVLP